MTIPPWGVSKVTVLLMSPSLAPFSTTTPAVIVENGQSFEVDAVNSRSSLLRRYLNLHVSPVPVGSRHGDQSCSVMFSLRTSRGWLVRQNCIYSQQHLTFITNNKNKLFSMMMAQSMQTEQLGLTITTIFYDTAKYTQFSTKQNYQCLVQHLISSEESTDSVEACVNLKPHESRTCSICWTIYYTEVLWNLQWHC